MTTKERPKMLSRVAGWNTLMGLSALFVLTELLPVIFGSGEAASWDWSFTFVTMRFIIVPIAAVAYLGTNVAVAVTARRLTSVVGLRCIGAATLVALCWIRQGSMFGT